MNYSDKANNGNNYWAAYVLTITATFVSLILSTILVELFAQSVMGYSLSGSIPQGRNLSVALALKLVPFMNTFWVLLLCIKYIHKRTLLSVFTARNRFDWRRFFTAFGLWSIILGIFLTIQIASGAPIKFRFDATAFLPLVLVALLMVPIQTATEDVLFRGYFFQGLVRVVKNGVVTILLLGGVFGWLHSGNPEVALLGKEIVVYYILSGVFLGLLAHLDDGLELGMGYHAANNIFGTLILTNNWQVFQSDALFIDYSVPQFGWSNILTVVLVQPLLLILFAKIYKWKNIRKKFLN